MLGSISEQPVTVKDVSTKLMLSAPSKRILVLAVLWNTLNRQKGLPTLFILISSRNSHNKLELYHWTGRLVTGFRVGMGAKQVDVWV
jgi:hypothetical protein